MSERWRDASEAACFRAGCRAWTTRQPNCWRGWTPITGPRVSGFSPGCATTDSRKHELHAAAAENRLALLPVERVLGARYTAAEIEERTGVPAGLIVRVRQLLGLPKPAPEERVFGDDDIETAQSLKLFLDSGFTEDEIAGITRVLGEGMSRLAATTTAAFVRTFLEAGTAEDAVADRFASMTQELVPAVRPILVGAFNAHLRDGVRRGILGREELEAGQIQDSVQAAVCFADLVGFTRLGGEVELEELGSVAGGLAAMANEVVRPPVRLIKTIGDAAMFVSPEPGTARRCRAVARRGRAVGRSPRAAGRDRVRSGAAARRGLLRALRQPRQPRDRDGAAGERPVHEGGARRGGRRVRVVIRRQAPAQGHPGACVVVSRPPDQHAG